MGIYIPGVKLPPNVEGCEIIIRIQPDGTVLNAQKIHLGVKAIELPPHGRLIDADAMAAKDKADFEAACFVLSSINEEIAMGLAHEAMQEAISKAETIIPADKEDTP